MDFDGNDDFVHIGPQSQLQMIGNLSVFAWFKADTLGVNKGLVTLGDPGELEQDNTVYTIQGAGNNRLRYYHENGPGNNNLIDWNFTFTMGSWYHVGIVRDVSANTVKFYVDGNEQQTFTYAIDPTGGTDTSLRFGSNQGANFFDGQLDDVQIYNRILSPVEVQTIFNLNATLAAPSNLIVNQ